MSNQDLDNFKALVVKAALKAKQKHNMCDEVDEFLRKDLGLGDLLPATYSIECRRTAKAKKWTVEEYGLTSVKEATEDAVSYRHWEITLQRPHQTTSGCYIDVTGTDLDALITQLTEHHQRFHGFHKEKFTPSDYPMYRVVSSKGEVVVTPEQVNAKALKT